MNGYVKLHRSLLDWGWYDDVNTKVVFIHLLLTARHNAGSYRGYQLKAGDVVIGRDALATALNLSVRSVRTALEHLVDTHELTIKTTNKFSVVSIVNWGKFQGNECISDHQNDQQPTSKRPTTDKQPTTTGEREKEKTKEYIGGSPEASPIVVKLIQNDGQFCEITQMQIDRWSELYPAVDVLSEVRKMAGWLEANKRKRKTKAGMPRFCANWLARIQDQGKRIDFDQNPQFV